MNDKIIFSTTLPIFISMINYGGHLGYDSLLTILQEVRLQWLKKIKTNATELNIDNNIGWIVKEVHVEYQSEAWHGDKLKIDLFVSDKTKTAFDIKYNVFNMSTNASLCHAWTKLVCYDYSLRKVSRIPEALNKHIC